MARQPWPSLLAQGNGKLGGSLPKYIITQTCNHDASQDPITFS